MNKADKTDKTGKTGRTGKTYLGDLNKRMLVMVFGAMVVFGVIITILSKQSLQSHQTSQSPQSYQTSQAQSLEDSTPLKDRIFWDTCREYPKFRIEAAEKVEELMNNGMDEEEACNKVIDETMVRIYEDKERFVYENNELGDGLEEAYELYLKETQY